MDVPVTVTRSPLTSDLCPGPSTRAGVGPTRRWRSKFLRQSRTRSATLGQWRHFSTTGMVTDHEYVQRVGQQRPERSRPRFASGCGAYERGADASLAWGPHPAPAPGRRPAHYGRAGGRGRGCSRPGLLPPDRRARPGSTRRAHRRPARGAWPRRMGRIGGAAAQKPPGGRPGLGAPRGRTRAAECAGRAGPCRRFATSWTSRSTGSQPRDAYPPVPGRACLDRASRGKFVAPKPFVGGPGGRGCEGGRPDLRRNGSVAGLRTVPGGGEGDQNRNQDSGCCVLVSWCSSAPRGRHHAVSAGRPAELDSFRILVKKIRVLSRRTGRRGRRVGRRRPRGGRPVRRGVRR